MGANSKKILSAVIGTLIAGAATTAVANEAGKPVFYGNFNVSVDVTDSEGAKANGGYGTADHVKVSSNNSRIGFTHELPLENGLTALVKTEVRVQADTGADGNGGGSPFSGREIYLGVKGDFGQAIAGRINRPVRTVEGRVDQFNHLYGDINAVLGGEGFANNVVQYSTPKFNNTVVKVAYIAAEDKDQNEASSAYKKDGYSASITYEDAKLYAAFGYETEVKNASNGIDVAKDENADAARLALSYKFGAATVGTILQYQENSNNSDLNDFGYVVNGSYTINKVKLKAQYGSVEANTSNNARDYYAVGADYALGKGSSVYGTWTQVNLDAAAGDKTDKVFQIGFNQAF